MTKLGVDARDDAQSRAAFAPRTGIDRGEAHFSTAYGQLAVAIDNAELLDGDVVLVDPAAGRLHRWLRRSANQNTLLITERCDQLCIMCSQPPKKTHVDLFAYFHDACLLAEPQSVIGISGGEPTLYKAQLFDLIERVHDARPDLLFHVLSNAQHFDLEDASKLRAAAKAVLWGVPVYAAEPRLHDEIVGKPGAFAQLERGLSLLLRTGARIELRTVVMQRNADCLRELSRWIAPRLSGIDVWAIMQLERQGFARARWEQQFFDHSIDFAEIGDAAVYARAHGVDVQLYNFPRCTVPPELRDRAPPTISDWKQAFPSECASCQERSLCSGLFAWHGEHNPYAKWGPL